MSYAEGELQVPAPLCFHNLVLTVRKREAISDTCKNFFLILAKCTETFQSFFIRNQVLSTAQVYGRNPTFSLPPHKAKKEKNCIKSDNSSWCLNHRAEGGIVIYCARWWDFMKTFLSASPRVSVYCAAKDSRKRFACLIRFGGNILTEV